MTRICVPVCVRDIAEMREAVERACEVAEVIELRLDCLEDREASTLWSEIGRLAEGSEQTVILTMRPQHEGGNAQLTVEERVSFWSLAGKLPPNVLVDLELDIVESLMAHEVFVAAQVICSHHDFASGTARVDDVYQRMSLTGAGVLKIAANASDSIDCVPIFQLLDRARVEGRELIAIAMGQAGVMTRILGPSRGSYLTYGSLDDDKATAPGQLTAREMRDVYRIDEIGSQTQIIGVIGRPVAHSLSPQIHNAAFAQTQFDAVLLPMEVDDVDSFIVRMVRPDSREVDWNLRGLAVTAPHKTTVIRHLDWIDPAAKEIGAVNTLVIEEGKLLGYNTDAHAFVETLHARFGSLANARCAIIGAGGAARAVSFGLKKKSASVTVFARDLAKAQELANTYGFAARQLSDSNFNGFDVVINATTLGTHGATVDQAPVTANQLRGVRLAYDLVYNPLETQFMRNARAAGCEAMGGLEMLIAQAVAQYQLWTGETPDVNAMRAAAERALRAD
jgi:3-dehydroquinate dehydratase/shikimate dehydrogenase